MTVQNKDYLFVTVPEDATDFRIWEDQPDRLYADVPYDDGWVLDPPLPSGSYRIIGKGDRIGWDEIVSYNHNVYGTWYRDYCNDKSNKKPQSVFPFDNPTESGHSLLRSLEMEPGTVLVLKKNEPIIQDSELHHPQYYPKSDKQR